MNTGISILLIDDEPDLLENLSLTLNMAGYTTVTATDGFEALTVLQTQPVGLILSDINMPTMDGYQLYNRIREDSQWSRIPFIFLTGCRFLSDKEIRYGKSLGIDEYLAKPIRSEQLLLAVLSKFNALDH
jgi:two-component system cell cycle response regulator